MATIHEINQEETIRWVAESPQLEHGSDADRETRATILAVVGLSENPDRPSHRVSAALQQMGYRIVPVNPTADTILGETAYPDLASVPGPVDVIQVFRRAEHTPAIAKSAVAERERLGARVMWLQEGIINEEAVSIARAGGMEVVMDRCLYKEVDRLSRSTPS